MENEKRLIDANALVDKFWQEECRTQTRRDFVAMVNYAPTVDAVEVVHGYWVAIPVNKLNSKGKVVKYCDFYYCSECRTERPIVPPYNYCPNCGAKMDGGVKNE